MTTNENSPADTPDADIPAPEQIPIVSYLSLGDDKEPHLVANECESCGARYFDRRNACARCGKTKFKKAQVASDGELVAFSIVHRAAPTIQVPYVSAIIKTSDGTFVRSNIINTQPDPEHVSLGMKVRLATYQVAEDDRGTKCIAFGYEPN